MFKSEERKRRLEWQEKQKAKKRVNKKHKKNKKLKTKVVVKKYKNYKEYLLSPEWKSKRLKVLKRANHICEICGLKKSIPSTPQDLQANL